MRKLWFMIMLMGIAFVLSACVTTGNYKEVVSQWKSHEDVANWMERYYSYDRQKFKKSIKYYSAENPPPIKTPEESFEQKSGLCFDAARFAKETLNHIDAAYEAEIVFIEKRPYHPPNHYVCSFKRDGKLYIMDYGTPYKSMKGVFGPYNSLNEYKEFYLNHHPKVKRIKSISFGWPSPINLK